MIDSSVVRRIARAGCLLVIALSIAVGCGDDGGKSTDRSTTNSSTGDSSTRTADLQYVSSPAVELRVTLDRLLGEHALLTWLAMTTTVAGEPDAKAVITQLNANTAELSQAMGTVYGEKVAKQFRTQWENHIRFLIEYADATASKNAPAKAIAAHNLAGFPKYFAEYFSRTVQLDPGALQAALTAHVQQLTKAVDQYASKDYVSSYATVRQAHTHMFAMGDALAAVVASQKPDQYPMDDVAQGAADTRLLLDQRLAEHAFLTTVATTKKMADAPDATAAAGALHANTNDLATGIGSIYGDAAKRTFLKQWNAHIDRLSDYGVALDADHQGGQAKAVSALDAYTERFATFLAHTTDAPKAPYRSAFRTHVKQLLGALDAADTNDADRTWRAVREAYAHMFDTGDVIADAVVTQDPAKFGAKPQSGESNAA